MVESVSDIASGLSQATTGIGTPSTMTISRPAKEALWAVFAVLIVIAIIDAGTTATMAFRLNNPMTAADIVRWLGWGTIIGRLSEAMIVFAIVSSRIARIDATVGGAHVDLTGTGGV